MTNRQIFHITHVDNLPRIIAAGGLYSDRRMAQATTCVTIGYDNIKLRRLNEYSVDCHPGTMVGDYVPFYFCPRSVMLFVIWRRNPSLSYQGGQEKIVHLVSDVRTAVRKAGDRPWAFSDGNAGASYTQFCADLDELDGFVDWKAVSKNDWRDPAVKEKKQAEFLVHDFFPWTAFRQIGVFDATVRKTVTAILAETGHQPDVSVERDWYYR